MRKLKLQIQLSLDGYIADVHGKTDWMVWAWGSQWTWDDALKKYFIELKSTVDCVLLSRKMAEEGFIDHWKKVSENTSDPQFPFAKKIAAAEKVVFTKTLDQSTWPNTSLAKGDLTSEVNQLKNKPGQDIMVYGGASFVSSLIQAGLIDEYHLFVNPTILGKGMPIFQQLQDKSALTLLQATPYACGVTVLSYSLRKNK